MEALGILEVTIEGNTFQNVGTDNAITSGQIDNYIKSDFFDIGSTEGQIPEIFNQGFTWCTQISSAIIFENECQIQVTASEVNWLIATAN